MRWITATQLEGWARTVSSNVDLPAVVADLIRASARDIAAMRFPSGNKGQVRGFDGHLLSNQAAFNVPVGRSFWEFGTDADYKAKALSDFYSRTKDVTPDEQAETTLVLVSPWTWDSSAKKNKLEDWLYARTEEAFWKDVWFIDGSKLELWFDHCPAVAAWHARRTFGLAPPVGVRSTDAFWSWYSGRFGPPLTEEVLLCGRDNIAKTVRDFLHGQPDLLSLVADAPDEAIAFAIAAIRKASAAERLFLEARTLVLDSPQAGEHLVGYDNLIFLVRGDAAHSPRQFSVRSPTLVPLGRRQRRGTAQELTRPSSHALGDALRTMGFGENEATNLARGSGRSLTALARLKPGGDPFAPLWLEHGDDLVPLILAGAWDAGNHHDREAVRQIAGRTAYDGLEKAPRRFVQSDDPPFDLEGGVWKVRAPMDAFIHIGTLIDAAAADRLMAVMIEVFGSISIKDDDPVDFFSSAPDTYSTWLREGLATTLLLLAVWGHLADVDLGRENGQAFANRVFEQIPRFREDHRVIESLKTELPLLAEAAPGPFLEALEFMLEGGGEVLCPLFVEKEGLLFPSPRYPHLIWALEVLAWDPETFRRAVMVIAQLASLDPGGGSGGRPINSLREIFVLWNPNTNASTAQRWAVLNELFIAEPAIGWELLSRLLPVAQDTSSYTPKPRLREAGASDRKDITRSEYAEGQDRIVDLAITAAGHDPNRWITVLEHVANFSSKRRQAATDTLESVLPRLGESARLEVWKAVRDEVARHENYRSAVWALPDQELAGLKVLVAKYGPADPVYDAVHFFDSWRLDDIESGPSAVQRRVNVVRNLYSTAGPVGLARLGRETRLPYRAVEAVSAAGFDEQILQTIFRCALTQDIEGPFTLGVAGIIRQEIGAARAEQQLADLLHAQSADDRQVARLLVSWPDTRSTWATVRRLGVQVETAYWSTRGGYLVEDDRPSFLRALAMLLRHGRAIAALESASKRLAAVPSRALLRLLRSIIPEINANPNAVDGTMLNYHVERVLSELDHRADAEATEIGECEFALLPLLRSGERSLRLHDLMASEPSFFSQIIANVYRGTNESEGEINENRRSLARLSYRLLSECSLIPGSRQDGIDEAALAAWVDAVRATGAETGRAAVTDISIGRLFAHAPDDPDGSWPHRAVRSQIERLSSEDLERQILVERFNMRGAYSKALYEGGQSERELAQKYFKYAEQAVAWPRTCELLKAMARDWARSAEQEDVRAAQDRLRS